MAVQSGQSARGSWARQDFILEYQDGSFPSQVCFSAWGQDKVQELDKFQVGDAVKVSFNVRAREYNDRWYNDLRIWRIAPAAAAAPSTAAPSAAAPYAPAPMGPSDAPAPTLEDMPSEPDKDDLPF